MHRQHQSLTRLPNMTTKSSARKAWELLDARERRNAFIVLGVMIASAFASAAMVLSIFPFLSVLSDPEIIAEQQLFKTVYDLGAFESDYDFVVALGLGSIGVIVSANLLLILNTWAVTRFSQMRVHTISQRLLAHYLSQPYEFFLERHSGDMSTNILSEASLVVMEVIRPLMFLISASLTVFLVIIVLLVVNPLVAGLTFGIIGSLYVATLLAARRFALRMGKERAAANELRFRIAGEALAGVKDVKLLGREAAYVDTYSRPSRTWAQAQSAVLILGHTPRFVIQIVGFGGIIILALALLDPATFGERDALAGLLPLLGLLAFAGQRLLPELQNVYQAITSLTSGSAALDRVHGDLQSYAGDALERRLAPRLRLVRSLTLEGLTYAYPEAPRPALDCLSLEIKAGERIGVIGSSGAGKTTLADIILGLLQPSGGVIRVDGQMLTEDNLRSWQRSVGYVPQDIFLTDASLAENIALGLRVEDIENERIERASRTAQLHEFAVNELAKGYQTAIGERGVRLSGGQRQRIGIARALYNDADLIVFDEATSALDNLTEVEVMSAIEALPGDKTVLIIAHRLSTVRRCDRILMLHKGCVAGLGSWEDLARESAEFRALTAAADALPIEAQ